MKKVIFVAIVIILGGAIGVKLFFNKKSIQANAEISKISVAKIPVQVFEIRKTKLNQAFSISGAFEPNRDLIFVSEIQGRVVDIFVDNGDFIQEGQLIAQLDTELINNELLLAEANSEKSLSELKRYENLALGNAVTKQQLEEIRIANKTTKANLIIVQKKLKNSQIKAPVSGTINKRYIDKGSYLMPGAQIVQIVDVSKLKIFVNISETEVLQIDKGQKVLIVAALFPDIKYNGVIKSISVKTDDTKNYSVEIEFENSTGQKIKEGMNGTVTFNADENISALSIPRECIIGSIKEPQIYTVGNDSVVHLKEIKIGKILNSTVEVLSGVTEGEKVVISGQASITEGAAVKIIK
jgi:membrane fusion protein, multidrug efflux system